MQATGVTFTMDEGTTLAHLLQLQLHRFEDEVRGIVDRAVKELSMEKVLKELQTTWAGMEFRYEPHPRTCVPLLQSDEDLIEVLEDNQVQLQNLMVSKHVAFFLEDVSGWQKKLSTADAVISIWYDVQRTWSHLESIFIGSEDIRAQLPQVPATETLLPLLSTPSQGTVPQPLHTLHHSLSASLPWLHPGVSPTIIDLSKHQKPGIGKERR